eukprot:363062-Chlamydomonas_euryale.AAC.13
MPDVDGTGAAAIAIRWWVSGRRVSVKVVGMPSRLQLQAYKMGVQCTLRRNWINTLRVHHVHMHIACECLAPFPGHPRQGPSAALASGTGARRCGASSRARVGVHSAAVAWPRRLTCLSTPSASPSRLLAVAKVLRRAL